MPMSEDSQMESNGQRRKEGMESKNLIILSTHNPYDCENYEDILCHVIGYNRYGAESHTRKFGEYDYKTYWKLGAYVTKEEELKIRELVSHSKYPNWHLEEAA